MVRRKLSFKTNNCSAIIAIVMIIIQSVVLVISTNLLPASSSPDDGDIVWNQPVAVDPPDATCGSGNSASSLSGALCTTNTDVCSLGVFPRTYAVDCVTTSPLTTIGSNSCAVPPPPVTNSYTSPIPGQITIQSPCYFNASTRLLGLNGHQGSTFMMWLRPTSPHGFVHLLSLH